MVKSNHEIQLGHSSVYRSIVNVLVMPFVIFTIIYYVDGQWSLLGSIMYLVVVSFLQWYRAKQIPTYENMFRKEVFFEVLGWSLVVVTGSVALLLTLVVI